MDETSRDESPRNIVYITRLAELYNNRQKKHGIDSRPGKDEERETRREIYGHRGTRRDEIANKNER